MTSVQKEEISDAFNDVRDDNTSTTWLVCKYEGSTICLSGVGENYDDLLGHFEDDNRAFAYVRVIMGDEMSKRVKFAFITWSGVNVGGMKKARMSTDKSKVQTAITNFAVEIMAEHQEEATLEVVKETLKKAGGANYGTGVRD